MHMIQDLGLEFATADLVIDHDDRPWFLEINPNGQWGWLQELTGVPLAERLVRRLSE
jgi:glutathione S-transferase